MLRQSDRCTVRAAGSARTMERRRRWSWSVLATAAVALALPSTSAASAWTDEADMQAAPSSERATFVYDPGQGNQIAPETLVSGAVAPYYLARGFDRNFLMWAPVESRGRDGDWAYCATLVPHLNAPCSGTTGFSPIADAIGSGTISVRQHNGAFIGIVCGNHSRAGATGPMPTITGVKYEDVDGDGTRDDNEPGLEGWTIHLAYGGGEVAEATTDADGRYVFTLNANGGVLGAGTYTLTEEDRDGWVQSDAPEPVVVDYAVGAAEFGGNDFGNFRPATIEGVKFDDHDVDGVRDADEPGLPGWTIGLGGDHRQTGADGGYRFGALRPGTYTASELQQAGWRQSAPASGTHTITVRSGETATADFGNVCLGTADVRVTDEIGRAHV